MTIFYGILSGVIVFVLGRFIEKIFIEPIKEHRMVIAEIYDGLIYHANKISNPLEVTESINEDTLKDYNQASKELRRMSTKLRAATYNLKGMYKLYSILFNAPKLEQISEVCGNLIGLSNRMTYKTRVSGRDIEDNYKKKELIMKKLKLDKFDKKL
ncbi:hypothetical protein [Peribacillus frigoritolerans]|uniref:hypothetical protein n=1 Tax=Peribacillus frigoritolerans TaxID=450367 RepID=UPI002417765D|nr:hypothetical protein [Peribacillus frigoritolerans]MDG4850618.1 hypothetical protein [Peribacillus frigoritolerans]